MTLTLEIITKYVFFVEYVKFKILQLKSMCFFIKFDIIFLDPPYKEGYIERLFSDVTYLANDSAAIICEVPKGLELEENINDFILKKRYRYGKTELVLYRKNDSETEIY